MSSTYRQMKTPLPDVSNLLYTHLSAWFRIKPLDKTTSSKFKDINFNRFDYFGNQKIHIYYKYVYLNFKINFKHIQYLEALHKHRFVHFNFRITLVLV